MKDEGSFLLLGLFLSCGVAALYYSLFVFRKKVAIGERNNTIFFVRVFCLVFSIFFITQALSDVVKDESKEQEGRAPFDEIALLIDTSKSMTLHDATNNTSRLLRAKNIAEDIVQQCKGIFVSLFAFESHAENVVSATTDYIFVRQALQALDKNSVDAPGTSYKNLFSLCYNYVKKDKYKKNVLFVLFTDGEDSFEERDYFSLIDALVLEGAKVVVVGCGSVKGAEITGTRHISKLDKETLEKIALHGKGNLYFENEIRRFPLDTYEYLSQKNVSMHNEKKENSVVFMLISLGFLFLFLAIPEKVAIALLFFSTYSSSLFCVEKEDITTGISYFEAGCFSSARTVFTRLFEKSFESDERAILLTNIALTYCYEKNFKLACENFQGVDPETIGDESVRKKFYEGYALCLIKWAFEENGERSKELLKQAKDLILLSGKEEALPLSEELYLVEMAKKRGFISVYDMEIVLSGAFTTNDVSLYSEAIFQELSWQKAAPEKPLSAKELLFFLDDRLVRERIRSLGKDWVIGAVEFILEALETGCQTQNTIWNEIAQKRTEYVIKEIEQSDLPYKKRAIQYLKENNISALLRYLELYRKPLNELFRMSLDASHNGMILEVLEERVQKNIITYIQDAKKDKKLVLYAWIMEDMKSAFSYLINSEKEDFQTLREMVLFAQNQKKLERYPVLEMQLFSGKFHPLGKVALSWALIYENERGENTQRFFYESLDSLISFEKEASTSHEEPLPLLQLSERHLQWVKAKVSERGMKEEIETLLLLKQSLGLNFPMSKYFHERCANSLEKIKEFYQKESEYDEALRKEFLEEEPEKLSIEEIYSTLKEISDEKEQKTYVERPVGERGW